MAGRAEKARKRVTINDIAREVDVSKATISHYINGRFSSMSLETKTAIDEAVKRLDYVPDNRARSLKLNVSRMAGIVVNQLSHQLCSQIMRGINEVCALHGISTMIYSSNNDLKIETQNLRYCVSNGVDAIALIPMNMDCTLYNEIQKSGTPIVMCSRYRPKWEYSGVYVDNIALLKKALAHFKENGYSNIFFLGGLSTQIGSITNREKAFVEYMDQEFHKDATDCVFSVGDDDKKAVGIMLDKLIATYPAGTRGVFANSTQALYLILSEIKSRGLRIPEDVAICGYDLLGWSEIVDPGITSLLQPGYKVGLAVGRQLIKIVDGPESDLTRQTWFDGELIIRQSTLPSRT